MAGVIERFVRPLPSQAAPPAATPTPPDAPVASGASGENEGPGPPGSKPAPARRRPRGATREAEPASDAPPLITTGVATPSPLKPVESIQSPQVETEPDAPATAASDERLNRLGLGAGAVWFSASSARATLDARYGRQVTRWLELVAGVGWLSGFRLPVASGAVSTDELRLLLATGARPLAQVPLHLELGATLRAVSARSAGIAVARQAVVWSPAVSAGVALRVQVGWVTLEAAVRGHLFFEELRFQVDASDVLVFRRAELSVTGGAFIHF